MPGRDVSNSWYYHHSQGFLNWYAATGASSHQTFLNHAVQQTWANQPPIPVNPGLDDFPGMDQHQPDTPQLAAALVIPVPEMEVAQATGLETSNRPVAASQPDPGDNEASPHRPREYQLSESDLATRSLPTFKVSKLNSTFRRSASLVALKIARPFQSSRLAPDSPSVKTVNMITSTTEDREATQQLFTPHSVPTPPPSDASPSFESARSMSATTQDESNLGSGEGSAEGAYLVDLGASDLGVRPLDTSKRQFDTKSLLQACEQVKSKLLSMSSEEAEEGFRGFERDSEEERNMAGNILQQVNQFTLARMPKTTDHPPWAPARRPSISRVPGRINDALNQGARETFGRPGPVSTSTPVSGQDCPVCSPAEWLKYSPNSRQGKKCTCDRIEPLIQTCQNCGKSYTSPSCQCIVTRSRGKPPKGHWDKRTGEFIINKK